MIDCVICLQLMKPPVKVLSCGHSFCLRCVRQMRRKNPLADSKRVKMVCPTCRHETPIPRGRASLLPNNYALHDILDKQQQQQQQVQQTDDKSKKACGAVQVASSSTSPSLSAPSSAVTYRDDEIEERRDDESEYDSINWRCPSEYCGYYNFSFRYTCRYCRTPRSEANFENIDLAAGLNHA